MRPEPPSPSTSRSSWRQFETFTYSAFRLEALQHYAGTGRDDEWISAAKGRSALG